LNIRKIRYISNNIRSIVIMKKLTKYLFVISFDGLSTLDFDYISTLPNFKEYLKTASYCKKVYSIYPSLTYPAHTSIITGRYPKNHGVINNTLLQPRRSSPDWYWQRGFIEGETLYDLAIKQGMKVAALLWPVTGRSKIQYNMPEIFANRSWQNQIMVSLLNGSPLFQIQLNSKFGNLRKGKKQPELDNFTHASFIDTIENKKPDISLIHFTDLDTMRHLHGFNSKEAKQALQRHDKRLGEIIKTLKQMGIYEDSTVILLGDHSSLDEDRIIYLNTLLKDNGYIDVDGKGKITNYRAISKSCDGSSYIYVKDKALIDKVKKTIEDFNELNVCFENIFTNSKAKDMGADPKCALMVEANKGYYFLDELNKDVIKKFETSEVGRSGVTKSTHGYSPYKPDYTTVFMASGKGIAKGRVIDKMNLVDEAPTMARLLGIEMKGIDGRVINELILD
jgi:predicted AlkP superfamily pyrophosphatase or phosphodiesterase